MRECLEKDTMISLHFVRSGQGSAFQGCVNTNGGFAPWLLSSFHVVKDAGGRSRVRSRGELSLSFRTCLLHLCVLCSGMEHSDSGRAEEEVRERSSRLVLFLELCGTFSVMSSW